MRSQQFVATLALAAPLVAATSSSLGCYSQVPSLTQTETFTFQETGYCADKCSQGKFRYGALQGDKCGCTNSAPTSQYQVADDKCSEPCPGFPADKCGKSDSLWSVISLTGTNVDQRDSEDGDEAITTAKSTLTAAAAVGGAVAAEVPTTTAAAAAVGGAVAAEAPTTSAAAAAVGGAVSAEAPTSEATSSAAPTGSGSDSSAGSSADSGSGSGSAADATTTAAAAESTATKMANKTGTEDAQGGAATTNGIVEPTSVSPNSVPTGILTAANSGGKETSAAAEATTMATATKDESSATAASSSSSSSPTTTDNAAGNLRAAPAAGVLVAALALLL